MRLFTNILDEGKRKYAPFDTKEAEVRFIAMYEGISITSWTMWKPILVSFMDLGRCLGQRRSILKE